MLDSAIRLSFNLWLLVATVTATASASGAEGQAANQLAADLAECSAYFLIVSKVPHIKKETPEVAEQYKESSRAALEQSMRLTSPKLARARTELALESMRRSMDGEFSNVAVVMNEYGYPCKDLAESMGQIGDAGSAEGD